MALDQSALREKIAKIILAYAAKYKLHPIAVKEPVLDILAAVADHQLIADADVTILDVGRFGGPSVDGRMCFEHQTKLVAATLARVWTKTEIKP